ncbi:MAG: hypothetical protein B0A82_24220 [Alkalinema sp. CACIAM 70d]|nr:MAG: hypothetical protein B0A82_24220 [Alkalinema sp. CACIAM 70d]
MQGKSNATPKLTLEDFLNYHDGTDNRYELVDGELKLMAIGTGKHGSIIEFLNDEFRIAIRNAQQPWTSKNSAVGVQSPRGRRWDTCRIPDVTVLPLEQWKMMADRQAVITLDQPPPLLVVEVVSESTKSEDYRSKHAEYCVLEIAEYWIVDPIAQQVTVCVFEDGGYTDYVFAGDAVIVSALLPALQLTVAQVLAG